MATALALSIQVDINQAIFSANLLEAIEEDTYHPGDYRCQCKFMAACGKWSELEQFL